MNNKEAHEKKRVLILLLYPLILGLLVYIIATSRHKILSDSLFSAILGIVVGAITIIPAMLIFAPNITKSIITYRMDRNKAKRVTIVATLFIILVILNELLILTPVAYKYLYFYSFPLLLGVVSNSLLTSMYRLCYENKNINQNVEVLNRAVSSKIFLLNSISFSFSIFLTLLYVVAVNFSFVWWPTLLLTSFTLYYSARTFFDLIIDFLTLGSKYKIEYGMRIFLFLIVIVLFGFLGLYETRWMLGSGFLEAILGSFVLSSGIVLFSPRTINASNDIVRTFAIFVFFVDLLYVVIIVTSSEYIFSEILSIKYCLPGILILLTILAIFRLKRPAMADNSR